MGFGEKSDTGFEDDQNKSSSGGFGGGGFGPPKSQDRDSGIGADKKSSFGGGGFGADKGGKDGEKSKFGESDESGEKTTPVDDGNDTDIGMFYYFEFSKNKK